MTVDRSKSNFSRDLVIGHMTDRPNKLYAYDYSRPNCHATGPIYTCAHSSFLTCRLLLAKFPRGKCSAPVFPQTVTTAQKYRHIGARSTYNHRRLLILLHSKIVTVNN